MIPALNARIRVASMYSQHRMRGNTDRLRYWTPPNPESPKSIPTSGRQVASPHLGFLGLSQLLLLKVALVGRDDPAEPRVELHDGRPLELVGVLRVRRHVVALARQGLGARRRRDHAVSLPGWLRGVGVHVSAGLRAGVGGGVGAGRLGGALRPVLGGLVGLPRSLQGAHEPPTVRALQVFLVG